MGWREWFGFSKPRDAPDVELPKIEDNVRDSGGVFVFGMTNSGERVDEKSALQIATVYACVRLLAETIASLPLHLYRFTEKGDGKERATDHPLYKILYRQANPEMTSFSFREAMMMHLLLWGIIFQRDEILHIPGLGFNGLVGFSPIAMMKNALGTTLAVEKYGSSFFRNGAQPAGVLEHPGVLKDPQKIRDNWMNAYGGANNAHKVAVLEEGMAYKPISLPPEDSQFLSTREFGVEEICRIFRVPPHMVQDLKRATFNNIEHQSIDFVMHTIMPWLVRIEQAIIKDVLIEEEQDTYFPKFNVDGLMRGDYKSRMDGYAVGFSNGFLSPNDIRRLENMDLIPAEEGGDDYYLNGSYTKLKHAGSAYGIGQTGETEKPEADEPEEEQLPDPDEEENKEDTGESKNHAQRHAQRKAQRRGGKRR